MRDDIFKCWDGSVEFDGDKEGIVGVAGIARSGVLAEFEYQEEGEEHFIDEFVVEFLVVLVEELTHYLDRIFIREEFFFLHAVLTFKQRSKRENGFALDFPAFILEHYDYFHVKHELARNGYERLPIEKEIREAECDVDANLFQRMIEQ